jgi:hypothetical protein
MRGCTVWVRIRCILDEEKSISIIGKELEVEREKRFHVSRGGRRMPGGALVFLILAQRFLRKLR